MEAGNTVVAFLDDPEVVWVDTGRREYSGTGRNRQTTQIVEPFETYSELPISVTVVPSIGSKMRLTQGGQWFETYWSEFGEDSQYRVYVEEPALTPAVTTSSGEKTVAGHLWLEKGLLICLPQLRFDWDTLFEETGAPNERDEQEEASAEPIWSSEAVSLGRRLLNAIVGMDAALRSQVDSTPPPAWSQDDSHQLADEAEILEALEKVQRAADETEARRAELSAKLAMATAIRALLYGTGKELESAVLEALELLGFTAEPFDDGDSQFDAVFLSSEGRFLGEVEGKENRAVNVDKLAQLERNIQEDFSKAHVDEFAKGVLFGNAFRLIPIVDRGAFFTAKCMTAARRAGVALVRTPDLYDVVRYLRSTPDQAYAASCRTQLLQTSGDVVIFPPFTGDKEARRSRRAISYSPDDAG